MGDPPPSHEDIENVLKFLYPCPRPVMFHCAEGVSRTGIVAAAYQLTRKSMKWDDALKIAVYHGFDPSLNPNQMKVMKSFEDKV
jgi:protein tyrosine/serine phosphatase